MNIKSLFLYRKQNCSYISQKLDFERFSRQRKKWLLGCFSLPQSERISFWKYSAIWNTDYLRQGLKRSFSKGFTSEIWAQKKKNYDASTFVYMLPVFYWKLATIFEALDFPPKNIQNFLTWEEFWGQIRILQTLKNLSMVFWKNVRWYMQ